MREYLARCLSLIDELGGVLRAPPWEPLAPHRWWALVMVDPTNGTERLLKLAETMPEILMAQVKAICTQGVPRERLRIYLVAR